MSDHCYGRFDKLGMTMGGDQSSSSSPALMSITSAPISILVPFFSMLSLEDINRMCHQESVAQQWPQSWIVLMIFCPCNNCETLLADIFGGKTTLCINLLVTCS